MPVITRKMGAKPDSVLVSRLVDEWRRVGVTEPRPTIIQEEDDTGVVVHLYVVRDDWKDLSQEERSAIITEAYWTVFEEKGLALTVAMGLLPLEAQKIGISF